MGDICRGCNHGFWSGVELGIHPDPQEFKGPVLKLGSMSFDSLRMVFRETSALTQVLLLMDKILHDLKDSKLWELWYIPYDG